MDNFNKAYTNAVVALLDAWVKQRSGLEFANYGDVASYRAEQRSITRDLHHYRAIRSAVAWREFSPEEWVNAFCSYSGRLTLTHDANGMPQRLNYCTGQYFPTEYRRAACAVLASLLWTDKRDNMRAPVRTIVGDQVRETYNGMNAGDYMRDSFKREFGRTIAARWFS
jgi:hypothetical protein